MDPSPAAPAVSPTLALLLAVTGLLATVVVPIVLALIARGGKSKHVELDPAVVIPRSEYDRLVDRLGDLDDALDAAQRSEARCRQQSDEFYRRAVTAEAHLEHFEKGSP